MEKHVLTKEDFHARLGPLRSIVRGKGRDMSAATGISYFTIYNYLAGEGSDPEKMQKILNYAEGIAREMRDHLNTLEYLDHPISAQS